ncbi:hypothetical protein [Pseudomonas sp. NCCP-436]|uniref:hypothetical protein n=1 Tax=Pseudomonas sp. NCCP-436 TaxID=2842481 RepID=UPI001C7EAE0B|nr:hypothetical protein [Pseudomonas sp. NCCP-436]
MHPKSNKLKISKKLAYISFAWLLLGITAANLLPTITSDSAIVNLHIYSNLSRKVDDASSFLLACLTYLATLPIIICLMRKHGFKSKTKSIKGKFFLITLTFISLPMALDIVPLERNTKYSKLALFFIHNWDWVGAALIVFIYLWITAFLISAATTKGTYNG